MFALWLQHESGFNRTASQFCAEYLSQSADLHFCCSSCLSLEFAFPCYFLSVINLASAESWWENYQKKKKMYELLFCHFFLNFLCFLCRLQVCWASQRVWTCTGTSNARGGAVKVTGTPKPSSGPWSSPCSRPEWEALRSWVSVVFFYTQNKQWEHTQQSSNQVGKKVSLVSHYENLGILLIPKSLLTRQLKCIYSSRRNWDWQGSFRYCAVRWNKYFH